MFVCPDKVGEDKRNVLKAYGAEVVVCPTAVDPDHPESYYRMSDRLATEIEGAWKPNQYANPENPESHYRTTGPEIWEQTDGRVTHFVAGIGTGGTISGIGRYLKEVSGGRVQIVGADPEGSVYSGGTGRPYLVEGVGEDFWPTTYDKDICDRIVAVSDSDSFDDDPPVGAGGGPAGRRVLRHGDRGRAPRGRGAGARRARRRPAARRRARLPRQGLQRRLDGRLRLHAALRRRATVGDVLRRKDGAIPDLVHAHPNETVADAVHYLREFGVSQMPVVRAEPPVMAAEIAGAVVERDLLDALFTGRAQLADRLEGHMSPPLPTIGAGEALDAAMTALAAADAALVLVDGKPAGVVTRSDVLAFLGS